MDTLERITINLVSIGWMGTNWSLKSFGINTAYDVVMILVGLSIVYFNIQRGLKSKSDRKQNEESNSNNKSK